MSGYLEALEDCAQNYSVNLDDRRLKLFGYLSESYPEDVLEQAVRDYVFDSKNNYFPSVGAIKGLADNIIKRRKDEEDYARRQRINVGQETATLADLLERKARIEANIIDAKNKMKETPQWRRNERFTLNMGSGRSAFHSIINIFETQLRRVQNDIDKLMKVEV
jgi:hypothetical protein